MSCHFLKHNISWSIKIETGLKSFLLCSLCIKDGPFQSPPKEYLQLASPFQAFTTTSIMPSPKIKLTYFEGRARAAPIRMLLMIGELPFENVMLKQEEFEKIKPSKQ